MHVVSFHCNTRAVTLVEFQRPRFTFFLSMDGEEFHKKQGSADLKFNHFLHDRPWISPWIKSISNELDITIHVIASQLSRYCDVIINRLWRHQQNEDRASETRGRCVNIVVFIVIHGFVISCKKSPRCFATREINTKITLSWVLKQFVTRVHTLFNCRYCKYRGAVLCHHCACGYPIS